MATYSANTPPPFEADKLADLTSVLQALPDNTSKMISPKDVRDATFTLWENTIYKVTNAGGTDYIGIDQDFITNKVYFGKKKVAGAFVMSNSLLATDTDYFFYNTKPDNLSNYDLKIGFLAGTGSNVSGGNLLAPYVYTRVTVQKDLEFEIVNPTSFVSGGTSQGGNIVLQSNHGHVILNGVRWPTSDPGNTSQVDSVLKYKLINGQPYAVWEANSTASVTSVISSGPVVIQGNPVTINNYPIEFTDLNPTPVDFGGILAGSTFSQEALVEMIRRMLYPYIKPRLTTSLNYNFVEFNDPLLTLVPSGLNMTWQLIKNSTYSVSTPLSSIPNSNFAFSTYPVAAANANGITNGTINLIVTGTLNSVYFATATVSWVQETFTLSTEDTYPSSVTSSNTVQYVIPWFYGTTTQSFTTATVNNILGTVSTTDPRTTSTPGKLTPLLRKPATASVSSNNQVVRMSTHGLNSGNTGYIYFGYPSAFPDLVDIIQGSFSVMGSFAKFTYSNVQSAHSSTRWSSKQYKFYVYVGPTGFPGPTLSTTPITTQINASPPYSSDFEFKFAL